MKFLFKNDYKYLQAALRLLQGSLEYNGTNVIQNSVSSADIVRECICQVLQPYMKLTENRLTPSSFQLSGDEDLALFHS